MTRAVLPLIERTGVATAAQVDVESLARRMGAELEKAGAVFAHPTMISAWATRE